MVEPAVPNPEGPSTSFGSWGLRVEGLVRVYGLGFGVEGLGFRVWGLVFGVQGLGL